MDKITEGKLQQIVGLYFDGYSAAQAIKMVNKKRTLCIGSKSK